MKRAIFERLTPKNRKNVPKFTKLSPTGGLRLQERMLLRNFEVLKAKMREFRDAMENMERQRERGSDLINNTVWTRTKRKIITNNLKTKQL